MKSRIGLNSGNVSVIRYYSLTCKDNGCNRAKKFTLYRKGINKGVRISDTNFLFLPKYILRSKYFPNHLTDMKKATMYKF